jgi:flavin reductase
MDSQNSSTSSLEYRDAMVRLPAAVHVITTDGPAGLAGFTASAVTSLSDTPPTLLVCVNKLSSVHDAVIGNRFLCVNTLSDQHAELSRLFGGKTPVAERFATARWRSGITGSPVLQDAAVSFDCEIDKVLDGGTHDILYCRVASISRGDSAAGLVYFNRQYHVLDCQKDFGNDGLR